ncbi:MAG: aspartate 1-decarboxylase [Chloroflexi bacterium]|nr:aspartate 1-decarboxylase [Chloroflexota bacterium]MYI82575.1 aspartate 1-decarboxylase [Chloroflexota bacterium]
MMRMMLRSKIHRATVTAADLDYEGSISIDQALLDASGIVEWEQVHVVDLTNGARLETYVIPAPAGSGEIQINGAAAHLVDPGDMVIIMAYEGVPEDRLAEHRPRIVLVDERNRVASISSTNLVNGAHPEESREPVVQGAAR